jgi:hypothetical protein
VEAGTSASLDEPSRGRELLAGAFPTIRYGPPTGDILIDLLAGLGTAWRFEDLASEMREFGGVQVTSGDAENAHHDEGADGSST